MTPKGGLIVALFAMVLLSGCADQCELPDILRTVDGDAPSVGGPGDHTLTIHIVDPTGAPVPSDVIIIWVDNEQPGGLPESLDVMVLGLRAGLDGRVEAHVPDDRTLAVSIDPAGHTREWSFDIAKGTAALTLVTVPREHTFTYNHTFHHPLPSVPPTSGSYELPLWHNDTDVDRIYSSRVVQMQATLRWDNAPLHAADLGFEVTDGERSSGSDGLGTSIGSQVESRSWNEEDLERIEWLRDPDLRASFSHDAPMVAHEPLDVHWEMQGKFSNVAFDDFVCSEYQGHDAKFFEAPLRPNGTEDTDGSRITPGLPVVILSASLVLVVVALRSRREA